MKVFVKRVVCSFGSLQILGYTSNTQHAQVNDFHNLNYDMLYCIENLRRSQRHFSHIATWKQEITNL